MTKTIILMAVLLSSTFSYAANDGVGNSSVGSLIGNYSCQKVVNQGLLGFGQVLERSSSDDLKITDLHGALGIDMEQVSIEVSEDCKVLNHDDMTADCNSSGTRIAVSRTSGSKETAGTETLVWKKSGANVIVTNTISGSTKEMQRALVDSGSAVKTTLVCKPAQ